MSVNERKSKRTSSASSAKYSNKVDPTRSLPQSLSSAMELLTVPVASVTDDGEILVNEAFAHATGFSDTRSCHSHPDLRHAVLDALNLEVESDNVAWIGGKRSFAGRFQFRKNDVESLIFNCTIASIRYDQTRIRQLQLHPLDVQADSSKKTITTDADANFSNTTGSNDLLATDKVMDSEWSFRDSCEQSEFPMLVRMGTTVLYANQAFLNLVGCPAAEQIANTDLMKLFADRELERMSKLIERRDRGEEVTNGYRLNFRHFDGQQVPTRTYSRPITWGGQAAVHSVCLDVTGEDIANRALIESENRLRSILSVVPCGVLIHIDGISKYVNPALLNMTRFSSPEEFLEKGTIWFLFPEQERLQAYAEERTNGREAPSTYETLLRCTDGSLLNVRVLATNVDWDGEMATLATFTDITDLSHALQRLQIDKTRARDFASTAASWFWETDKDDRITMVGREYRNYSDAIGNSIDSVIGKTRAELYPEQRKANPDKWLAYETAVAQRIPFNDFELVLKDPDGIKNYFSLSGIPFYDDDGEFLGYRGSVRDVSEERRLQARIRYAAEHDDLTKLANRKRFAYYVDKSLGNAKKNNQQDILGFLDLDGFKIVNDNVGHSVGDELLVQCARIFNQIVHLPHKVARLGGDEFGFLLSDISVSEAKVIFETIINAVSRNKFVHNGRALEVGASIGVVIVDKDSESRESLMSQADIACYAAKDNGRNQVYVFSESDEDARRRRREVRVASDIQQAINSGRMLVYAQTIVDLGTAGNPPVHNEILVRMQDLDGSIVTPNAFIPAAERFQLAESLDRYMIDAALSCMSESNRLNNHSDTVGVSINLSGDTLSVLDFDQYVLEALERHNVAPEKVCFEITETAAIRNLNVAIRFIESTRALGCRFSLDDFGAGLSSFAYLKDFNIDQIKIDGRFIRNIVEDDYDQEIVSAITRIGSSLRVTVVAEHVEDARTAKILKKLGVDYGQGYYWSKPTPYKALLAQQNQQSTTD